MSRATVANKMMCLIVSHLLSYVTIAPYSSMGVGASLNYSIYYNFLCELRRTPSTRSSGRSLYITTTSPLHRPYEGVREARPLYSSKVISSKRNITKTTPTLPLTRYLLLRGRAKACPGPIGPGPLAKGRDARWVLWLLVLAQENSGLAAWLVG